MPATQVASDKVRAVVRRTDHALLHQALRALAPAKGSQVGVIFLLTLALKGLEIELAVFRDGHMSSQNGAISLSIEIPKMADAALHDHKPIPVRFSRSSTLARNLLERLGGDESSGDRLLSRRITSLATVGLVNVLSRQAFASSPRPANFQSDNHQKSETALPASPIRPGVSASEVEANLDNLINGSGLADLE